MTLLELAQVVATKYPVFPLDNDKRPLEGSRGFKDGTRDPTTVDRLFSDPRAVLIGVPTGETSGLFVLDIDPKSGDWLEQNRERLPATRAHDTRRGKHFLYRMPAEPVGSSRSKVAFGVDIRANGGYAVWWPAAGLTVENATTIAEAPEWLVTAARSGQYQGEPGNDLLGNFRPVTGLPLERASALLPYLDVDNYDDWLGAGMAFKHEFGDAGFEAWHQWTQTSDLYQPGNGEDFCRRKWDGFGRQPGKPMTLRTVINAAKRRGAPTTLWGGAAAQPAPVDVLELVKAPPAGTERRRFRIDRAVDFAMRKPPGWLVRDLVPRAALGLIYAEPGAGKTFFVLDLALHMAAGKPWREKATKGLRVAYIVAEGMGGFSVRLRAASLRMPLELDGLVFDVVADVPNLLDPAQVADLIAQLKERGQFDVVFVDTFAQVTAGGNENAGEDMGRALSHCRAIHEALSALVVLVHHAGKDPTKGARGWSGIRAAVDFEIELVRMGESREARVTKQKDGRDGAVYHFRLENTTTDLVDEDGEPAQSCYVLHVEQPVADAKAARGAAADSPTKGLGKWQRAAMNAALDLCAMTGECLETELADVAAKKYPAPAAGTRDRRLESAREAICDLVETGKLTREGAKVKL